MSSQKLLLAIGICVGVIHCPPYLVRSETSHLSQLTNLQTTISAATPHIEPSSKVSTGQIKQSNSCASMPSNRLEQAIVGQESHSSCHISQIQHSQYLYLRGSTSNHSTVVLDESTAGTSLSRVPKVRKSITEQLTALVRTVLVLMPAYFVLVISSSSIPVLVISILWLYFTGSLFFDIAHYFLHKFSKSSSRLLRRIGYLHEVHHLYFNRRLKFNDRYLWQNMLCELPLELSCQLFGTWLGYLAAQAFSLTGPGLLSQELFHLVLFSEVIRSFVVAVLEGRDSNHQSYLTVVPKDPHFFLVGPEYHALHHVDPSAYISSSFRVFDWFLGTSYTLRSRRVTLVGLSGGFGQALKREVQFGESMNCIQELSTLEDDENMEQNLSNTDILIIGHEEDNCESVVKIIELFKQRYKPRPGQSLLLPEVWYICNQSQKHSSSSAQATFTNHARKYYNAEDNIYRHIVLSKPTTYFGYALLGPDFAAKAALWWIRRGARYVPVTTPLSAVLGYFTFFYSVRSREGRSK